MYSPVLAFEKKKNVSFLFPQGWGFFTKDPREVTVDAYHIQNSRLELKTIGNTQGRNLFGISRNNRYVGYGLRFSSKYGTVHNVKGNKGVFIEMKSGKRKLIGT